VTKGIEDGYIATLVSSSKATITTSTKRTTTETASASMATTLFQVCRTNQTYQVYHTQVFLWYALPYIYLFWLYKFWPFNPLVTLTVHGLLL